MRYRAKPVELEAIQWNGDNFWDIHMFAANDVEAPNPSEKTWCLRVHTTEGVTYAPIGHYIVRDDRGNHYPCEPGVFERKYEPIE